MKKLPWITTQLLILVSANCFINAEAARSAGVKAVILYTYDDSQSGSNVVTMEVDKETFMNVIKDSQTNAKDAKPLRFSKGNGFFELLDGDSASQFSFATTRGMADCDCKCLRRETTTTSTTTTTPKPTTTTTRRTTTTTTTRRTTPRTTTVAPTYLPPSTTPNPCPLGGTGPFCCLNGANNRDCCANGGSGPDCCTNGGKGKYCCTNGANTPDCKIPELVRKKDEEFRAPTYLPPETTTPNPCPLGGSGPYCCKNGANNKDCCKNGGSGKYCCLNGVQDNPDCSKKSEIVVPIKPQCPNGGKLPHCCLNGANNAGCVLTTKAPYRGPTYLPVARITTQPPSTTTRTYTYGERPTYTYKYSYTGGNWTWIPRSTVYTTRETTTTAKYAYDQPNHMLNYNGADNLL